MRDRHSESPWPPAWAPAEQPTSLPVGSAAPARGGGGFPPEGWPTKEQIDYAQAAILLLLLLLALPWVLSKLLTNPSSLVAAIAGRRML